jgi:hypothetical protein
MNKNSKEQIVQAELDRYFECSKNIKCPTSMKKNLYQQISDNNSSFSWIPSKMALAGISLVFVTSIAFKIVNNKLTQQKSIDHAQAELMVAMHYINRVSFKSISSVNNNGIKPGLIRPLARSVAQL